VLNPELIFQSGLTFFGLTLEKATEHRVNVFTQIHEIVFWGNGGYSWGEVYNMPVWLRQFTFSKLRKYYEDKLIVMVQKIEDNYECFDGDNFFQVSNLEELKNKENLMNSK
jgi:hypothetical protein